MLLLVPALKLAQARDEEWTDEQLFEAGRAHPAFAHVAAELEHELTSLAHAQGVPVDSVLWQINSQHVAGLMDAATARATFAAARRPVQLVVCAIAGHSTRKPAAVLDSVPPPAWLSAQWDPRRRVWLSVSGLNRV